jgi:Fe2+ or Zn2+ uptake regulation protein
VYYFIVNNDVLEMVRENASRNTQLRKKLREILHRAHAPRTVTELRKLLLKSGMTPHKTSLYRNLDHMVASGEVDRVMLDTNIMYFELQNDHHHHIMCTRCHAILCVGGKSMEKRMAAISRDVEKESHFFVTDHQLALYGLCNKCNE